jgi:hypothetical protein
MLTQIVKLADFTAGAAADAGSKSCTLAWTLRAELCNRGAIAAPAGVPGAFYGADPTKTNSPPLCTTATTMALPPGGCETVTCDWQMPMQGPLDLWFRADDDGAGNSPDAECKTGNDLLFLPAATCTKAP